MKKYLVTNYIMKDNKFTIITKTKMTEKKLNKAVDDFVYRMTRDCYLDKAIMNVIKDSESIDITVNGLTQGMYWTEL